MGISIYLKVPLHTAERLRRKPARRPLLAQLPQEEWPAWKKTPAQRAPFYAQADETIAYTGDEEAFFEHFAQRQNRPTNNQ